MRLNDAEKVEGRLFLRKGLLEMMLVSLRLYIGTSDKKFIDKAKEFGAISREIKDESYERV